MPRRHIAGALQHGAAPGLALGHEDMVHGGSALALGKRALPGLHPVQQHGADTAAAQRRMDEADLGLDQAAVRVGPVRAAHVARQAAVALGHHEVAQRIEARQAGIVLAHVLGRAHPAHAVGGGHGVGHLGHRGEVGVAGEGAQLQAGRVLWGHRGKSPGWVVLGFAQCRAIDAFVASQACGLRASVPPRRRGWRETSAGARSACVWPAGRCGRPRAPAARPAPRGATEKV